MKKKPTIKKGKLRNNSRGEGESQIGKKIEDYLREHKTVLATYGNLKAYRIKEIDFDGNPAKTTFTRKNKQTGNIETLVLKDYYKSQYNIKIKDLDQPILIAETKERARKKNK